MSSFKNSQTVHVCGTKNGRYAVLVREKPEHAWTQIESIIDEQSAKDYAEDYVDDPEKICDAIADLDDEEWGADAPVKMPK